MVDNDKTDEALNRLRASDPATGSHTDLHHLRSLVAAKAPASVAGANTSGDDLSRDGRTVAAPWIAAAAVAALGMGAGGYALGSVQSDPPTAGTLAGGDSAESDDAQRQSRSMLAPGSAADSESSVGDEEAMAGDGDVGYDSGGMYDAGPVRLSAGPGLSTEGGTGEVRALRSEQEGEEFLLSWAERLDLEVVSISGSEYLGSGSMMVNSELGIVLSADNYSGSLDVQYEDVYGNEYCSSMYDGMSAGDIELMRQELTEYAGPDYPMPDPDRCREPEGPLPTDEQAVAASMDFMRTMGADPDNYTFDAQQHWDGDESRMRYVEATLDGAERSGPYLGFSFSVGPEGVVSAYGSTGEMVSLGDYPLISPVEAVERYAQREFAADYAVYLEEEYDEAWMTMPYPDLEVPDVEPMQPGDPVRLLRMDKVITSAELVSGSLWTQTGNVEVPVWKLTAEDGMHYPVLALSEDSIEWLPWSTGGR